MADFDVEREGVGEGWHPIVDECHRELSALLGGGYELLQIKEKFGGLRYYIATHDSEQLAAAEPIIRRAEALAAVTCEFCGDPGELVSIGGWWKTLCGPHAEERRASREFQT